MADEPKDRLRQARIAAGYTDQASVVRAFGWNAATYKSHELGTRGISQSKARLYARRFHVAPAWLLCLTNEGGPAARSVTQGPTKLGGEGPVDAYRMALALTAAQEIGATENLAPFERQMTIVRMQLAIYRFLTKESERGVEVDEDMARRIAALIRDSHL